ncbi:amino acid transporter [Aaosphaeria arxii CBS 175.79]|uniref:Amino acid transporter n=1 Tax=Aaosphaeria arxii CBS 175.79 TaxID=1450172 RepID=A0A6A5XML9_9PLEO|nr:amino acid transporter [Aaosphaeria arxii CBS 175.79]KAF2014193.1 amino acid transporter [Aaosphaeria arxii CBS 175.79]
MDHETDSQPPLKRNSFQAVQDARDLADMGHDETLSRKFGLWSMFFLSVSVLGTWSTFAQGLNSGLTSGGPITILWGLVLVFICNICVAVSLAELCSAMPTALGQAYWISRLWPRGRFVSYLCAWINTFGWWTLSASQLAFMTDFILAMKVLYVPDWSTHGWVKFLLYLAITLVVTLFNVVACRRDKILPIFNNFVGICFISLFFIFILALLISVGIKEEYKFQPAKFVFATWINQSGWGDGVTWFIGLVQAAYGLTAFDAAVHLVEEVPSPRTNIPRVMWLSVTLGAVTGFIFMMVCLFSIQSIDDVVNASTGLPFMDLLKGTVGLTGSTVLLALFIFNGMGQAISLVTTASRLTWGVARDGGIPWGGYFGKVNNTWKAPVRALWLQGGIIGLVGVLYTFADTVLEAILGVSTIALTISYAMPILTLLLVGRDKLPSGGPFRLGRFGPVVNWVSVIYCSITTVFFFFPDGPNPSGSDMNYAIAVFGIMLVITCSFWVIRGSKSYLQTDEAEERVIYARRVELVEEQHAMNAKDREARQEHGGL